MAEHQNLESAPAPSSPKAEEAPKKGDSRVTAKEEEGLYSITYVSRWRVEFTKSELNMMANKWEYRNRLARITSCVVTVGALVFQILEGPEEDVSEMFDKHISPTPLHTDLTLLYRAPCEQRRFSKMPMHLIRVEDNSLYTLPIYQSMVLLGMHLSRLNLFAPPEIRALLHLQHNPLEYPIERFGRIVFAFRLLHWNTIVARAGPASIVEKDSEMTRLLNLFTTVCSHVVADGGGMVHGIRNDTIIASVPDSDAETALKVALGAIHNANTLRQTADMDDIATVMYLSVGMMHDGGHNLMIGNVTGYGRSHQLVLVGSTPRKAQSVVEQCVTAGTALLITQGVFERLEPHRKAMFETSWRVNEAHKAAGGASTAETLSLKGTKGDPRVRLAETNSDADLDSPSGPGDLVAAAGETSPEMISPAMSPMSNISNPSLSSLPDPLYPTFAPMLESPDTDPGLLLPLNLIPIIEQTLTRRTAMRARVAREAAEHERAMDTSLNGPTPEEYRATLPLPLEAELFRPPPPPKKWEPPDERVRLLRTPVPKPSKSSQGSLHLPAKETVDNIKNKRPALPFTLDEELAPATLDILATDLPNEPHLKMLFATMDPENLGYIRKPQFLEFVKSFDNYGAGELEGIEEVFRGTDRLWGSPEESSSLPALSNMKSPNGKFSGLAEVNVGQHEERLTYDQFALLMLRVMQR